MADFVPAITHSSAKSKVELFFLRDRQLKPALLRLNDDLNTIFCTEARHAGGDRHSKLRVSYNHHRSIHFGSRVATTEAEAYTETVEQPVMSLGYVYHGDQDARGRKLRRKGANDLTVKEQKRLGRVFEFEINSDDEINNNYFQNLKKIQKTKAKEIKALKSSVSQKKLERQMEKNDSTLDIFGRPSITPSKGGSETSTPRSGEKSKTSDEKAEGSPEKTKKKAKSKEKVVGSPKKKEKKTKSKERPSKSPEKKKKKKESKEKPSKSPEKKKKKKESKERPSESPEKKKKKKESKERPSRSPEKNLKNKKSNKGRKEEKGKDSGKATDKEKKKIREKSSQEKDKTTDKQKTEPENRKPREKLDKKKIVEKVKNLFDLDEETNDLTDKSSVSSAFSFDRQNSIKPGSSKEEHEGKGENEKEKKHPDVKGKKDKKKMKNKTGTNADETPEGETKKGMEENKNKMSDGHLKEIVEPQQNFETKERTSMFGDLFQPDETEDTEPKEITPKTKNNKNEAPALNGDGKKTKNSKTEKNKKNAEDGESETGTRLEKLLKQDGSDTEIQQSEGDGASDSKKKTGKKGGSPKRKIIYRYKTKGSDTAKAGKPVKGKRKSKNKPDGSDIESNAETSKDGKTSKGKRKVGGPKRKYVYKNKSGGSDIESLPESIDSGKASKSKGKTGNPKRKIVYKYKSGGSDIDGVSETSDDGKRLKGKRKMGGPKRTSKNKSDDNDIDENSETDDFEKTLEGKRKMSIKYGADDFNIESLTEDAGDRKPSKGKSNIGSSKRKSINKSIDSDIESLLENTDDEKLSKGKSKIGGSKRKSINKSIDSDIESLLESTEDEKPSTGKSKIGSSKRKSINKSIDSDIESLLENTEDEKLSKGKPKIGSSKRKSKNKAEESDIDNMSEADDEEKISKGKRKKKKRAGGDDSSTDNEKDGKQSKAKSKKDGDKKKKGSKLKKKSKSKHDDDHSDISGGDDLESIGSFSHSTERRPPVKIGRRRNSSVRSDSEEDLFSSGRGSGLSEDSDGDVAQVARVRRASVHRTNSTAPGESGLTKADYEKHIKPVKGGKKQAKTGNNPVKGASKPGVPSSTTEIKPMQDPGQDVRLPDDNDRPTKTTHTDAIASKLNQDLSDYFENKHNRRHKKVDYGAMVSLQALCPNSTRPFVESLQMHIPPLSKTTRAQVYRPRQDQQSALWRDSVQFPDRLMIKSEGEWNKQYFVYTRDGAGGMLSYRPMRNSLDMNGY